MTASACMAAPLPVAAGTALLGEIITWTCSGVAPCCITISTGRLLRCRTGPRHGLP